MTMAKFSKYTARVAVVTLVFVAWGGITLIPTQPPDPGTTGAVWPLPEYWAKHHMVANVELFIVWMAVGVTAVILMICGFRKLLVRAGWLAPPPKP